MDFIDGDGTARHWKYPGAYADQPAIDIDVYRVIRGKWVELQNAKIAKRAQAIGKKGKALAAPKPVGAFRRMLGSLRRK